MNNATTITWTASPKTKPGADWIGFIAKSPKSPTGHARIIAISRPEYVSATHAEDRGHHGAYWTVTVTAEPCQPQPQP